MTELQFAQDLAKEAGAIMRVAYDPIMDRLFSAEKGKGAFMNGETISVSSERELSSKSFVEFDIHSSLNAAARLKEIGCYTPVLYSCVYASMLVAVGEFTGAIYVHDKPWDAAAVKIIVEEAGGKVTDLEGREQRYDGTINGFVASNGHVHQALIDALK